MVVPSMVRDWKEAEPADPPGTAGISPGPYGRRQIGAGSAHSGKGDAEQRSDDFHGAVFNVAVASGNGSNVKALASQVSQINWAEKEAPVKS